MPVKHFVHGMNKSISHVEKSVEQMVFQTSMTKAEQQQIMQALLELSEKVKLIETYINMEKRKDIS
ncbi:MULTISPECIES: hypothetical protein [unclassified Psychrobacillus]|uniref:hypothetical protein n=1 Tax=unclassified Psychrobacillus TaxID=2636677 RepID=UPI0011A56E35|nr:hypothetical protein GI482_12130 [Bacillus sp. N3536]